MRSFAPTDSRPGSRLAETHIYATPVVREQPSKFSVAVTKRASNAHDGE